MTSLPVAQEMIIYRAMQAMMSFRGKREVTISLEALAMTSLQTI